MYLARLEKGNEASPPIAPEKLDDFLRSHLIDPILLRSDDFAGFMVDRQRRLLALIEGAIGKPAYAGSSAEEGEDVDYDPSGNELGFDPKSVIAPSATAAR
jgi:hypothetical protein